MLRPLPLRLRISVSLVLVGLTRLFALDSAGQAPCQETTVFLQWRVEGVTVSRMNSPALDHRERRRSAQSIREIKGSTCMSACCRP